VRIQAWALARLMVTPVFRILTGSIIRQCEMGQKNSVGGEIVPPRELLLLRSSPTCLLSCFLSPALQPHISLSNMPSLLRQIHTGFVYSQANHGIYRHVHILVETGSVASNIARTQM